MTKSLMRSLYVHFPFCESKCHYCDFYSLGRERTKSGDPDQFKNAFRIGSEQNARLLDPELDTIFFGGSTPSMTPCDSMKFVLEPLWKNTRITKIIEWTMEAIPSFISPSSFKE